MVDGTVTVRRWILIAALALLAAACSSEGGDINDDPNAGNRQEQLAKLAQRPSIEEATQQYQRMLEEIRQLTTAEYGLPPWGPSAGEEFGRAGCGFDFPDVNLPDGQTVQISGGVSLGNLPDDRWDEAVLKIAKIAAKYGFDRHQRMYDKPGEHDVYYKHPDGSNISFGTAKNTSIGVSSGCHLTAEAKRHVQVRPPDVSPF